MKKRNLFFTYFKSDSLITIIYFFIIILLTYYFRSFFSIVGIYVIIIALLPALSFTYDDLQIRKYFINRNNNQIRSDKAYFKKIKTKDWRVKEGYGQKNKYFFLLNKFLSNVIGSIFVIYIIILLVVSIIMGMYYLWDVITKVELPFIGNLSIWKIIGLIFLASIISSIYFTFKEKLKNK